MPKACELTGQTFGYFTVLEKTPKISPNSPIKWKCVCRCGSIRLISSGALRFGTQKSCGCIVRNDKVKFLNNIVIDPISKCWEWQKSLNSDGYAKSCWKGKEISGHRLSWILHKGEIPKDMNVLHKCDNRKCVNPEHLFLGTQRDNWDDCLSKGRHRVARGAEHYRAKFTEAIVIRIRTECINACKEHVMKKWAKRLGVSFGGVRDVVYGQSWKHIPRIWDKKVLTGPYLEKEKENGKRYDNE